MYAYGSGERSRRGFDEGERRGTRDDRMGYDYAHGGNNRTDSDGYGKRDYFQDRHEPRRDQTGSEQDELEDYLTRLDREDCFFALRRHGIESLDALRHTTIDQLERMGIKKGHAILISRAMDRNDILTSLHYAASNGDFGRVKALLNSGQSPIARDENGRTPLMYAMDNPSFARGRDFVKVVTALVEARVKCRKDDPHQRDREFAELIDDADARVHEVFEANITSRFNSDRRSFLKALGLVPEDDAEFALQDLDDDTIYIPFSSFRGVKLLDEGNYGLTYEAHVEIRAGERKGERLDVVCKVSRKSAGKAEWDELEKLRNTCKHKNVCSLIGLCADFVIPGKTSKQFAIVLPHYKGGSLKALIWSGGLMNKGVVDKMKVCKLAESMAAGLKYVHTHLIVHRDVAPRNFCVKGDSDNTEAVIIDFGFAREMEKPLKIDVCYNGETRRIRCHPTRADVINLALNEFFDLTTGDGNPVHVVPKSLLPSIEKVDLKLGKPKQAAQFNHHADMCVPYDPAELLPFTILAPELLIDQAFATFNERTDVYALGLSFLQMFEKVVDKEAGRPRLYPFHDVYVASRDRGENKRDVAILRDHYLNILRGEASIDFSKVFKPFRELLARMLSVRPTDRPTSIATYDTLRKIEKYLEGLTPDQLRGDGADLDIIPVVREEQCEHRLREEIQKIHEEEKARGKHDVLGSDPKAEDELDYDYGNGEVEDPGTVTQVMAPFKELLQKRELLGSADSHR